jgi:FkbM family methyltransferase
MKKSKLLLNNKEIIFNYPEGDDGIFGMFSCLRENKFHLQEIDFNDGDYFIDIGCNVGILSIIVATLFPKINVISIDASAEVIECLNESIKDNNLSNIKTYNYAVGSKEDKLKFFSDGKNSCLVEGDLAYSSEGNKNTTFAIEVDQIKIDKIFAVFLSMPSNFIKL